MGTRITRTGAFLTLALLAAGCSASFTTDYALPDGALNPDAWRVTGIRVEVTHGATTTEANRLAPDADIVWHGDFEGDRKVQTAAILEEGLRRGARGMDGARRVGLYVLLDRFHGVTPSAVNQAPSAVHDIEYRVWVMDQETGTAITGPIPFEADLLAYTKSMAAVAAAEGRTEKERIIRHVARITRHWLGISEEDPRGTFASIGR